MKITEVSVQKNNPSRVSVYVDGKYAFSIGDAEAVSFGIKPGREIEERELTNFLFESQFGKARDKAMEILSRKSISSFCLGEELIKKGCDKIVADTLIEELKELGYLDDHAYALLFLEHCREKLWGRKKAEYELKQKGIDQNTIDDALFEVALPDAEEISKHIGIKYAGEDTEDFKVRQRIMRFFVSRGFEFSEINDAIKIFEDSKKD